MLFPATGVFRGKVNLIQQTIWLSVNTSLQIGSVW
jgi:hypothetical protein